jgi:hypothetical protein
MDLLILILCLCVRLIPFPHHSPIRVQIHLELAQHFSFHPLSVIIS